MGVNSKNFTDGVLDKYKARLVAGGFLQAFGVDYIKTFNPVIKTTTTCVVLTISLFHNQKIRQVDVYMK